MGKRRIKHLGRRNHKRRLKSNIYKLGVLISIIASIVALINITKYIDEYYKGKNVSQNTIEFYMGIADEVGEQKVQLSWKELLAIDMVKYDKDLTSVKKREVIDVAEKFIKKQKGKDGKIEYRVKTFDKVLNEIRFDNSQKNKANTYLKELSNKSLGGANLKNQNDKIEFVKMVSKESKSNYDKHGILPSITTAQAILESGWGQSSLTKNSNNVFGIKADKQWTGKKVSVSTSENYNDKITAEFRVYNSMGESIKDQGDFLAKNKRYTENGLFEAHHYTTQAQALENAGYSTKKNKSGEAIYADMLIDLIQKYNLMLLDREVQTTK